MLYFGRVSDSCVTPYAHFAIYIMARTSSSQWDDDCIIL